MPTQKPRITFAISEEEFQRIQDYQFENRMKNQSQAILQLLRIGFQSLEAEIEKAPPKEDEALLDLFHQLNAEGKQKLLDYADDLVESGKYIKTVVGELA